MPDSLDEQQPAFRKHPLAVAVFAVFWAFWMTGLAVTWTLHPDLDHGDAFTDACVVIGGYNYDRTGLRAHAGLPLLETDLSAEPPPVPYAHYPPLPWWIHQSLKKVGLAAMWQQRLLAVCATAVAAWLMFAVMSRLAKDQITGLLAAVFYMASAPFVNYADSIYQFAYGQLAMFGCLLAWLAAESATSPKERRRFALIAGVLFFVDGWITFEHIPLIAMFVIARTLLAHRPRPWIAGAAMLAVPLVVVGTRILHNAAGLGGFEPAVNDLVGALNRRSGQDADTVTYFQMAVRWFTRLGGGDVRPDHFDAEFRIPLLRLTTLLPAAVLLPFAIRAARRDPDHRAAAGLINAGVFVLGFLAWLLVLRQHAYVHRHPVMVLLPGVAMLFATLIASVWQTPKPPLPLAIVGAVAAVVLAASWIAPLRGAVAFNQFVALDGRVRAAVLRRRQYFATLRKAQPAFQDIDHLQVVAGLYPQAMAELRATFRNVDELPDTLPAGGGVWITPATQSERAAAAKAFAQFGFPDVLAPTAAGRYVFRATPPESIATDIHFAGGFAITAVRLADTLDGDAWAMQLLVTSRQSSADFSDVIAFCHVLDALDRAAIKQNVPLDIVATESAAFATFSLPKATIPPDGRLVFGLWSRAQNQPLRIVSVDRAPQGTSLSPDRTFIAWSPADWPTKSN